MILITGAQGQIGIDLADVLVERHGVGGDDVPAANASGFLDALDEDLGQTFIENADAIEEDVLLAVEHRAAQLLGHLVEFRVDVFEVLLEAVESAIARHNATAAE